MHHPIKYALRRKRITLIQQKLLNLLIKDPVEIKKGKRLWIRMLGDSAADKPCANYNWAINHFREHICIDKEPVNVYTGGGMVQPKYCIDRFHHDFHNSTLFNLRFSRRQNCFFQNGNFTNCLRMSLQNMI